MQYGKSLASDTRIQVNLILVELLGKYVPVHYLGVVSLGLNWQLNKDVSFSQLVPNLASVPLYGQEMNATDTRCSPWPDCQF
jgi:hypothetical protein